MNLNAQTDGFTLIEMMITISIAAILLTVAIPSFQATINNTRLVTQTNELVTDLALAKSEAVKRGRSVSVCVSAGGAACAGAGTWALGWMVFTDANADGVYAAATDTILKVHEAMPTGTVATTTLGTPLSITYSSTGTASATGDIELCRSNAAGRTIGITATGRTNITRVPAVCP